MGEPFPNVTFMDDLLSGGWMQRIILVSFNTTKMLADRCLTACSVSFSFRSIVIMGWWCLVLIGSSVVSARNVDDQEYDGRRQQRRRQIQSNNRNLQSLEQIWDLSRFEYRVEQNTANSTWNMIMDFTSSNRIEDDMARVDLLDPLECTSWLLEENSMTTDPEVLSLFQEIFTVTGPSSSDPIGRGYGFRNWTSTVSVYLPDGMLDAVSNETSPVFTEVGGVQFCVRISLAMPPGDDDYFSERPITQYGKLVTVVEGTVSGSISDFPFPTFTLPPAPPEARAVFCDTNNVEMDTQPLLLEGDIVRICIFPPEGGDYTMVGVDFFQFEEIVRGGDTQPGDDSGNTTTVVTEPPTFQAAITTGGEPSMNQLTQYECTPQVCVIQSVLFAAFYEPNTAILAAGYATFMDNDLTGNATEPKELGSDVKLAFETLLKIVNFVATKVPTVAPSSMPSDMPSYMPSTAPSMAPTSGVSVQNRHYPWTILSLALGILLLPY